MSIRKLVIFNTFTRSNSCPNIYVLSPDAVEVMSHRRPAYICIYNELRDNQASWTGRPGIYSPAAEPGNYRNLRRCSRRGRAEGQPVPLTERNCEPRRYTTCGTGDISGDGR